ncbi:hypothetical protein AB0I58_18440, partial [Spirillospora sp. NPDC050365]
MTNLPVVAGLAFVVGLPVLVGAVGSGGGEVVEFGCGVQVGDAWGLADQVAVVSGGVRAGGGACGPLGGEGGVGQRGEREPSREREARDGDQAHQNGREGVPRPTLRA